jgi:ubiquinone biosynthesis protein
MGYFLHHRSHLRRYRQIAGVLTRHGLGFLVSAFGLERFVPLSKGVSGRGQRERRATRPERLRMALEELGACFIKLGQIISTRPDLLPPEYRQNLLSSRIRLPLCPGL